MGLLGETAAFSIALFVMLLGLVGVILPVLPGLVLIWGAALGFALLEKFATIGPFSFTALTLLAILGISADIWMTQLGAKMGGATFKSQLTGLAGGILGAILGPILGAWVEALLGPVLGAILGSILAVLGAAIGSIAGVLVAEYLRLKEWRPAIKAGGGWMLGWLASTLFQIAVGGVMILLFLWQAFAG